MAKIFKTTCPRDCYDACGMTVTTDEQGQIVSLKGEKEHPVTQGFLCPRGNKDLVRLVNNRIKQPHMRRNGRLKPISWEEVLDFLAQKINKKIENNETNRILYIDYAGYEGLVNNIFARRLWYALQASFSDGTLCTSSGHAAINLHYGISYGVFPEEFKDKKLIVFWGANPAVTGPHIWKFALDARKKHGTKIVVVDPIVTKTAQSADLYIQPAVGSDTALVYAVIKLVIERKDFDEHFINEFTTGFDKLSEFVASLDLSQLVDYTNVNKDKIETLAKLYAQERQSVTMIGVGLQKRINGFEAVRAVSLIPALIGCHRCFYYSNSRALNIDIALISGKKYAREINEVSQIAIGKHLQQNEFDIVIVNSTNLLVTHPESKTIEKSFTSDKILSVVFETHWSETAKAADIVLPVPTFLEKQDVMLSWSHQYTRVSPKIIEPMFHSRPEWEIMQDLANRLNVKDNFVFENPFDVVRNTLEGAIEQGEKDFLQGKDTLIRLKTRSKEFYPTHSGKIEFCSSAASEKGLLPLPQISEKSEQDGFVLLTTATAKYTNSQFVEVYGANRPSIRISQADAHRYGFTQGQEVVVYNSLGSLRLEVEVVDFLQPSVVWMPRFTKDLDQKNMNILISGTPQKLGGGPTMHSTRVFIKAAEN